MQNALYAERHLCWMPFMLSVIMLNVVMQSVMAPFVFEGTSKSVMAPFVFEGTNKSVMFCQLIWCVSGVMTFLERCIVAWSVSKMKTFQNDVICGGGGGMERRNPFGSVAKCLKINGK